MFKNILIPVDLAHEEQLSRLMEAAVLLIGSSKAKIDLLYVDQSLVHQGSYPYLDETTYAEHKKAAKARLQHHIDTLAPAHVTCASHIRNGAAHDHIVEEAKALHSDAILMMAKRPGISSYFIGSTAERVVRHADCSVFVIRDE
ncbi:universal stress protein [Neptunomonas antarctica]|uniref:Universal stress protein F n=1 Tax=Neptunomonas antarctica TaxID=619304 RepID=A0A1N7JB63_9GAMM|nr:universal stress protein [Neptunomonas antarctica]SIS46520.1 universal stress protein F [Neptunomonas antarctica]